MHIPIKVDYGVRALVDLALHQDKRPVRASEIAKRTMIPEQFLAQVLLSLSRHGLVKSQRGPQGGHVLAKDPYDIRLSAIMSTLGVGETPVACLDDINMCIHVPACAQREVWRSVAEAVYQILDSTTIGELAEKTRASLESKRDKTLSPVEVVVG
jgi:Rrf2 family protein